MAPITRIKPKPEPKSDSEDELSSSESVDEHVTPYKAPKKALKKKRKSAPYVPISERPNRINETPEQKATRLAKQRATYKRRIANETPAQREKRLRKTREINNRRNKLLKEDETPEEREERLKVENDVRRLQRQHETEEQSRARKKSKCPRVARRKRIVKIKDPDSKVNLEDHEFYCEFCSTIILMRFRYIIHLKHHINRKGLQLDETLPIFLYICDYDGCQLCYRDKGRFVTHLESHSATRTTFDCSVCEKRFAKESNCEQHMELAHGPESADYEDCAYCHLVIKKEEWDQHYVTHRIRLDEKEGNHLCEACGKTFGKEQNMRTHVRNMHQTAKPVDPTPRCIKSRSQLKKDKNAEPCTICGKILLRKEEKDSHMLRFHTYEHGTECYVCGKRYEHLHTLLAHIRKVHTNEPKITKQPTCHYCPRIFSGYWMMNKHHFIDHRAEYLKDKAFCCGVCFRHFAAKQALTTHLLVHERWKCPICSHREISQISHDMHLRTHNLGPWAATKKRNIKYRRGKREATVEISEAEKKLVEGANHYYQRGVGWLEIPSVLSNINSSQDGDDNHPAQEDAFLPNAVVPNANSNQYFHFMLADQERQSQPLPFPYVPYVATPGPSRSSEGPETVSIAPEPVVAAEEPAQEYAPPARPKKYKCDRCPGQFSFPKYLLTHIAWHVSHETANVEILKAPAQAVLSAKPTEEELAKYKNPDYVEEENEDAQAKRHVCPECAELFHHLPNLNRHRRLEHGVFVSASADQEVKCEICSLSFARQNYLNLHIQAVHTDKPRKRQRASTPVEMVVDVKPSFEESPWTPWAEAGESEDGDSDVDPVTAYRERTAKPKPSGRRRKQGSPQKIEKKRPAKKSRKSAACTEPFASTSRGYNQKWTCGECPMAFIRETALKQHKLTHDAARAERDDGQPEWILPHIKLEPQDEDDADWENDNNTAPASPGSDNSDGETQQLPSVRQLKLRSSQSLTTLSPHLRQAAESLPQLFVPLPRVRIPRRKLGKVPKIKIKKEFERILKKSKAISRLEKRKRDPKIKKPRKKAPRPASSKSESDPAKPKKPRSMGGRQRQVCEVCGKDFHPNTHMDAHMATHSNVKPFKCDVCEKEFAHEKHLKDHRRRNHVTGPEGESKECPICGKGFKSTTNIEAHIAAHTGLTPFQCDVCLKQFPHERQMYDHKRRNHLAIPRPRKSQKGQIRGRRTGFEQSEYYCDICFTAIKYKSRYDRHMRTHFDVNPELEKVIYMYQCDACPEAYRLQDQFLLHLESHSSAEANRAVVCSICNKAFALVTTLEEHVKSVHEAEGQIFDCVYCPRNFRKEADWKIHEGDHSVDLSASRDGHHMCAHCGQTFKLLATLNGHILQIHEGDGMDPSVKPRFNLRKDQGGKVANNDVAPCQVCGEKFGKRQALKSHLLKEHTYEHGLVCFVCNKKFSILGHLTRHLRDFHKDVQSVATRVFPKNSKGKRTAYSCPHCPVVYYGGTLRLHKHLFRVHHEAYMLGKPIYCQLCYKNFATEEELEAHRPAHDGIKCERCGEQFLRQAFLNAHMLRCVGERRQRVQKSAASGSKRMRRPRSDKNLGGRHPNMQMSLDQESSSGSSEDEYQDQPVFPGEAQSVSTHGLGLIQHPLHLVHPPPWLPPQQQQHSAEELHFSMESFLHWN